MYVCVKGSDRDASGSVSKFKKSDVPLISLTIVLLVSQLKLLLAIPKIFKSTGKSFFFQSQQQFIVAIKIVTILVIKTQNTPET